MAVTDSEGLEEGSGRVHKHSTDSYAADWFQWVM